MPNKYIHELTNGGLLQSGDLLVIERAGSTYYSAWAPSSYGYALSGANADITSLSALTTIKDSNNKNIVMFSGAANAVNYFDVINSASGSSLTWQAAGTDTNVSISFICKGSGKLITGSTNTSPIQIRSGTNRQHITEFAFADTNQSRTVTFPDVDGTATLLGNTTTGTGSIAMSNGPSFVAPALGTPASGTLTNCTGYTVANISGLGTGVATFLATPSSSNLAAAVTGETGSGALVFGTSPTLTTPDIVGVTGGGNANAGSLGQLVSSTVLSGSAVSLTTNTVGVITTISLTAGDWDVRGYVNFTTAATTNVTRLRAWISSSTSSANDAFVNQNVFGASGLVLNLPHTTTCPVARISISSTTTINLLAVASFTVDTCSGFGYIEARRVR